MKFEFYWQVSFFFLFSFFYLYFAKYFRIIDKPNHRSLHSRITVRGLGLLFLISILLYGGFTEWSQKWFIFGALLIGGISFVDDILTTPAFFRFPFQVLAVAACLIQLGLNTSMDWIWLVWLFLGLLGIGFVNAFNFMDGVNGMTGLYSLVTSISVWFLNDKLKFVDSLFLELIMSSLMVFLFFNFRVKALAFSGDVGSITIAYVLFFVIITICLKENFKYLFFVGLYGLDTFYTILYRINIGEKILQAHKLHFYQLLVHKNKQSHLWVSFQYAFLQGILNMWISTVDSWYLIILPFLVIAIFMHIFRRNMGESIVFRSRNEI